MTQDPGMSAEQVAALEKRLADTAAALAEMQAELAAAKAPMTPAEAQTVFADQMRGQLPPGAVEQLTQVMQRLGLDQTHGPALGLPVEPANTPSPEVVGRLADPPRPVPLAFRAATFDWSWWELWTLVMLLVTPIALWIFHPHWFPAFLLVIGAGVLLFRGRRYAHRIPILKWGKVATVTGHRLVDKGTYYSGMTYNNMRMRSARGWAVTTQWYSGPGYTTDVSYLLDGTSATVRLRGLPYVDGVILADSRKPTRAMGVHQFPFDLTPGSDGRWQGRVSAWRWFGICLTLVMETSLVALAVILAVQTYA